MEINLMKIRKLLSSRSLPADEGTVTAIAKLVRELVEEGIAEPVPESKLGVYLSHNYFEDFPIRERSEPGPVPSAIRLLDELQERRKKDAA